MKKISSLLKQLEEVKKVWENTDPNKLKKNQEILSQLIFWPHEEKQ